MGNGEREAGLADPAGPGQGQQGDGLVEQEGSCRSDLRLPTNQAGAGNGERPRNVQRGRNKHIHLPPHRGWTPSIVRLMPIIMIYPVAWWSREWANPLQNSAADSWPAVTAAHGNASVAGSLACALSRAFALATSSVIRRRTQFTRSTCGTRSRSKN